MQEKTDNVPSNAARRHTAKEQRQFHVESWQKSGLSMSEYCRKNNLSLASLRTDKMQLTIQAPSILVCAKPVDFRKAIDGLLDIVLSDLTVGPRANIFIFYNRGRDKIKVLAWHKNGFMLLLKRLEKGQFFGSALEAAGSDSSIQVDHTPETFKVIEHITLKYCCRQCETIRSAKKPETAIPKCMATAGFIAEVIAKKYEQHLPLYRQSKIFERLGAVIPDNTLGNWVMRAADALVLLGQALREQIPCVKVLQSDDTKVKTIKPNKEGYFWGYHGCDTGNRFVLFEYSASRAACVPNATLKGFTGVLQTDGYSGYND